MLSLGMISPVGALQVEARVLLAGLLGVRVRPLCPHCNAEGSKYPCQSNSGSNSTPVGCMCGRCDGLDGAEDTQRAGNLHCFILQHMDALAPNSGLTLIDNRSSLGYEVRMMPDCATASC